MDSSRANRRSVTAVNEILSYAKVPRSDVLPTSQALFFQSSNLEKTSFQFLELNNELLKLIENNEQLTIKGNDDDEVVICSETTTFHANIAETSNSLLLVTPVTHFDDVKDLKEESVREIKVAGVFQVYLEANVAKTSMKKLFRLLEKSIYRGPEYEKDIDQNTLYTLEELKKIIQVSNKELIETLNTLEIFEINGFIREIEFEYLFRVLSYMIQLIEENSWSLDTVDFNETIDALNEIVPEEIIIPVFEKYTEKSKIIDGMQLYKYKETEVCKFFARVILRTAEKFNFDEFMQAWSESVPEGMITNEEMLYGIAIIDKNVNPKVIWAFEENNLPDNIQDRLQVLFQAKEKWTVPEISPYIRGLATNKLDVNALLAKHARASKVGDVKYYSAKHAK